MTGPFTDRVVPVLWVRELAVALIAKFRLVQEFEFVML